MTITPNTIITAELLAGLAKCPFCGAGTFYSTRTEETLECGTYLRIGSRAENNRGTGCYEHENETLRARVKELEKDCKQLQGVAQKSDEEICQTLGQSLGYPWFKDDPKNFPESTEADGVCVGDHCGATLALEMKDRVSELEAKVKRLTEAGGRACENSYYPDRVKVWKEAKDGV
jgi:hypothetical protein